MARVVGSAEVAPTLVPRAAPLPGPVVKTGAGTPAVVTGPADAETGAARRSEPVVREVLDVTGRRRTESGGASGLPLVGRPRAAAKEVVRAVPVGPVGAPTIGPHEVPQAVAAVAADAEAPTGRARVAVPRAVPGPVQAQGVVGVVAVLLRRTLHAAALVPVRALDVLGASVEVATVVDGVGQVTGATATGVTVPPAALPVRPGARAGARARRAASLGPVPRETTLGVVGEVPVARRVHWRLIVKGGALDGVSPVLEMPNTGNNTRGMASLPIHYRRAAGGVAGDSGGPHKWGGVSPTTRCVEPQYSQ